MQLCRHLKVFLVELALGWAGEAHGLQLHGDWKLPKMRYKGSPTPQKLALVRQQQVCQVCCHDVMPMCLQGIWLHPAASQGAAIDLNRLLEYDVSALVSTALEEIEMQVDLFSAM